MKKLSLGKAAAAVTAGLMLASTFAMPVAAVAEQTGGSTDVTIQAAPNVNTSNPNNPQLTPNDMKIAFKVPSVIPFAAKADGTLVGPSADKVQVSNESVFGVQVTRYTVRQESGWHIVSDPTSANASDNSINFQLSAGTDKNAVELDASKALLVIDNSLGATTPAGIDTSTMAELSYTYKGGTHDNTQFNTTGKVSKITNAVKNTSKIGTITWSVEAK